MGGVACVEVPDKKLNMYENEEEDNVEKIPL